MLESVMSPKDALREALVALCQREGGADAVADKAEVNAQNLTHIMNGVLLPSGRPRGVGPQLAEKLERAFPGWASPQRLIHSGEGVAHDKNLKEFTVPHLFDWGEVMADKMPTEFRTIAPDDALAPRLRTGQVVTFDRNLSPRAGDAVLLTDRTGSNHIRLFRPVVGRWEAHALQPDWPVMDSERDGLKVVAVLTGVQARWG